MNTLFETSIMNYSDEWFTPLHIIKALGPFDLDPASPIIRPWDIAAHHFNINDDGLIKNWFGRVFCNPPYSIIEPWIRKCATHANTVLLTFARTETQVFHKWIFPKADSIFFFEKRLQFIKPESIGSNKRRGSAGAPSVLVAFGLNNVISIEKSGLQGRHIPLNIEAVNIIYKK